MAFITIDDFPASVHDDILTALIKGDQQKIDDNIDRSIDEMRAYLSGRYDNAKIFAKEGDERNKYLLRLALNITMYWIYKIHNPRKLTQHIVDDYERTLETLEKIQKGTINPEGLETPANPDDLDAGTGAPVQWGSTPQMGSEW